MKWAGELGQFEKSYKEKSTIKVQALADFIVELSDVCSLEERKCRSYLYMDHQDTLVIGPEHK